LYFHQRHQAVGRVWVDVARQLADSLVLPYNVTDFSTTLNDMTKTFLDEFATSMQNQSIDTSE